MVASVLTVVAAKESKAWPSVAGSITFSAVVAQPSKGGMAYVPEVKYRYVVGNTTYEGNHIWLSGDNQGEDRVRMLVAEFPSNSTVPVFYKPSLPSRAVLKTGTNWLMFSDIGLSLTVFVIGVVACPGWKLLRSPASVLAQAPIGSGR